MKIQAFLETLTECYIDWGTTGMQPKTDAFGEILEQVKQPTTANFLQLLTSAAEYLEEGETIAEIGCLGGANLIGILTEHRDRLAYGVDFFSTKDEVAEENIELLQANLDEFGVLERFMYLSQACRDRDSLWVRNRLVRGNYYMAHKTAFTAEMLKEKLLEAGFSQAEVKRVC